MTIEINEHSGRSHYTATNGQTIFAVPFEFFEAADIKVYQNGVLLEGGYTVTGARNEEGGTLTLASGAALGDTIAIVRDTVIERASDFPLSGPFRIEKLNDDLDRLTAIAQETDNKLKGRVLRLADGDSPENLGPLPSKAERAGSVLSFDAEGNPVSSGAIPDSKDNSLWWWNEEGAPSILPLPAVEDRGGAIPVFDENGTAIDALPIPAQPQRINKLWYWDDQGEAKAIDPIDVSSLELATNFRTQTFTGNGLTTTYNLSDTPLTVRNLDVFVDGVRKLPVVDYNLDAATLVMAAPVPNNSKLFCKWGEITPVTGEGAPLITYAQDNPPSTATTTLNLGDLWFDTNDANKLYRWNGSSWILVQDQTIAAAQLAAQQALTNSNEALELLSAMGDGVLQTYYQPNQPASASEGDLWFDTDDGNKLYRYSISGWVAAADNRIANALTAAAGAQATADGKVTTYYQNNPPAAASFGDLWIDANDSNRLYRWNGTQWVDVQDGLVSTALNAATQAQTDAAEAVATANAALDLINAAADGKIDSFFAINPPTAANAGDLWFDSDDNNKLYRYSGSGGLAGWQPVFDTRVGTALAAAAGAQATADGKVTTFYQASAPTIKALGDLWIDSDDSNKLYRWSGTAWTEVRDSGIPQALTNAQNALTIANQAIALAEAANDGVVNTYFQTSAPSVASAGDLWFDTDDGNKIYRYSGSSWVNAQDSSINSAVSTANSAAANAATALSTASSAQSIANGKIATFYSNTTPTSPNSGDLWYKPSTGVVARWSGSAWVDVASLGASWAANLTGIPSELLDNRLATAIGSTGILNTNVVPTGAIQTNAVTKTTAAASSSSVSLTADTGLWTTIQSVTVTTSGGDLIVTGNAGIYCQEGSGSSFNRFGVEFILYRDGTNLTQSSYARTTYVAGITNYLEVPISLSAVVTGLAAGTYTFYLYGRRRGDTAVSGGASTSTMTRFLSVTELKR